MSAILRFLTAFLFMTAISCTNEKKEEPKVAPATATPEKKAADKTEISVSPTGGEVKTKDATIKLNTKDTTKH
jgi:hypothetical protein